MQRIFFFSVGNEYKSCINVKKNNVRCLTKFFHLLCYANQLGTVLIASCSPISLRKNPRVTVAKTLLFKLSRSYQVFPVLCDFKTSTLEGQLSKVKFFAIINLGCSTFSGSFSKVIITKEFIKLR